MGEAKRIRTTIADRIVVTGGRATGFDYLRIGLAISIVAWHTIITSYGEGVQNAAFASHLRPLFAILLPLFFALSGFLVAGSLERTPELARFLGLRTIRIIPALAVETIMSAFILGPVLTSLPFLAYFKDYRFHRYLYNVAGWIHYTLPGVFSQNPYPSVINAQLWTVPYELECYILLAILAFLGVAQRRQLVFLCALGLQIVFLLHYIIHSHGIFLVRDHPMRGHGLVMTFLAGVVLYSLRDRIPFSLPLFIACTVCTTICLSLPIGDFLVPYSVAYMTVYLGLQNPKATTLHKLGDLSYGIFLYGFPIQQLVASWGPWARHWWINLIVALPITILIAAFSWNIVEKPTLKLKRHLGFLRPVDAALERIKRTVDGGRRRLVQAHILPGTRDVFLETKTGLQNDASFGG